MFTFNFTSKAQYLEQRAAWLVEHDAAILAIRKSKEEYKELQRQGLARASRRKLAGERYAHLKQLLEARAASRCMAQQQYEAKRALA